MAYFRDWFGRSADQDYTHYDQSRRSINWDYGYTNYSDYFFGGTKIKKVDEAASLLLTMSKVMGINRNDMQSYKEEGKVMIPTDLLKNDETSTDVFLGAALQNMASKIHQTEEEHKISSVASKIDKLSKFIYKSLNAERINNLMAEETPGYLKFVQKYKKHKFESRPKASPDKKDQRLMDLFDRIIRYPADITEEEVQEFQEPIDKIKELIQEAGGIPSQVPDCVKLSKKISGIISDYLDNESSSDSKDSDGNDDSDDTEENDDAGGSESKSDDSKTDESKADEPKKQKDKINDDLKDYLRQLAKSMEENDISSSETYESFSKALDDAETSSGKHVSQVDYVIPSIGSSAKSNYKAAYESIDHTKSSVLAQLLKRKNRDYQFSLKSMRTGRLDTNKLAEAKQGVSTIYERLGQVKTDKLSVTVLVDESGSMAGDKINAARQAAVFLSESLSGVKDVELFIYGHTADWYGTIGKTKCSGTGSTQLIIYREPGMQNPLLLGEIEARYENRDGVAILAAAKRVRTMTQNNGVLVVISDGYPSAHAYGDGRTHTRKMAVEAEKMGFEVIQVTIGGHRSSDMFKHVINLDDVSTFPTKFVGFLKKKINSMIKETVRL